MNLKLFPLDVIRLIYSFGYPKYKKYMSEICSQISFPRLEYNLYMLKAEYYKFNNDQAMIWFFTNEVDEEVIKDLFKQCTKCCCCSKHCHNRPTNYYTDEVSVGENFTTDEICNCGCRSISRDIKRINSDNHKSRHIRSTFNKLFIFSRSEIKF